MSLSKLQRYILHVCAGSRQPISRTAFLKFYQSAASPPRPKDQGDSITKSIERLISRGFVVGYGEKTAERLFIRTVKITPAGRRASRRSTGRQQTLHL